MCRYAFHRYLSHYACIPCRFSAKHGWRSEPICPHCCEPMTHMGMDFKAPRRNNLQQWEKVRRLTEAGVDFNSCGCSGPGYRPKTLGDAKSELRQRRTDRKVWAPRRHVSKCRCCRPLVRTGAALYSYRYVGYDR